MAGPGVAGRRRLRRSAAGHRRHHPAPGRCTRAAQARCCPRGGVGAVTDGHLRARRAPSSVGTRPRAPRSPRRMSWPSAPRTAFTASSAASPGGPMTAWWCARHRPRARIHRPCRLGPPGGPSYAQDVAAEVTGLRTLVEGPHAAVPVARARRRVLRPRSRPAPTLGPPSGWRPSSASIARTGAPTSSRVQLRGGRAWRWWRSTDLRFDVSAGRPRRRDGGHGEGRRPRHGSGASRRRFDAVGGSRNPRPVPVLTSGGDDRRSLGPSTHTTTTLSGFSSRMRRKPDGARHAP